MAIFSKSIVRHALLALAVAALQACATLPSSGPSGNAILKDASSSFDVRSLKALDEVPAAEVPVGETPSLDLASPFRRADSIGPGDLLDISVYEVGIALFGGSGSRLNEQGFDPSARAERFPSIRVGDDGFVELPYVGRLFVDGVSTLQLQGTIAKRLRGKSQEPQVLVRVVENTWNSIVIGGEVARPGRFPLTAKHETLGEMLAVAGGYKGEPSDLVMRFSRGKVLFDQRLSQVMASPLYREMMHPGDHIELLKRPQSFSVLGGAGRIDVFPFGKSDLTLAEAISRAGGTNENQGDPAAIFVFRNEGGEKPVVYHINLMRAEGYFIAKRFVLRDEDLIYFGNARANAPGKLVQLISQLFTPIVTARAVTR